MLHITLKPREKIKKCTFCCRLFTPDVDEDSLTQYVVHELETSASPEKLLEVYIFRLYPRSTELESLGCGPGIYTSTNSSGNSELKSTNLTKIRLLLN